MPMVSIGFIVVSSFREDSIGGVHKASLDIGESELLIQLVDNLELIE